MLTPPEAYGTVESGIYRCAAIDPFNFAFLDTLGLRSIIVLNLNRPPKVVRTFASDRNIEIVHSGLRPWMPSSKAEWMVLSQELIVDSLSFVLDTRNHPVLVLDATNAFIGTLRRAQHWNFSSVLSEYRAFSGGKPHYMTELFLELIDIQCMDHTEALRRRQSIEGMAHAAVAAAAIAATGTLSNGGSGSSSAVASANASPSVPTAQLATMSLTAATASANSTASGIATPRSSSFSAYHHKSPSYSNNGSNPLSTTNSNNNATTAAYADVSGSPVPQLSREHFFNVISREDSAVYDSDGSVYSKGHSGQGHVVVLLPPSEYLPEWFRRQQDLWERDRREKKREVSNRLQILQRAENNHSISSSVPSRNSGTMGNGNVFRTLDRANSTY